MAKKQAPTKNKTKNKTKSRNKKMTKTPIDEYDSSASSSDDADVPIAPSSSTDSPQNDVVVVESSDADVDEPNGTSSTDDEEIEEKRQVKKKSDSKSRGKKRSQTEDDDDDESDAAAEENNGDDAMYRFPMNRISRIIRSDNPDVKISQEAVFLINRASEKFLQVFCREAYACLFLDDKTHTAYNHLSSVVAKRKRFGFLSDFVPEKVKAEDALAETSEAEN